MFIIYLKENKVNVCFIGKHKYPKDVFSNEQDMKTWRSMADYFNRLFIVVQSPDLFFYRAKEKNVSVYLVPNFLGYFGFIVGSVKLGFYLNLRYGIDVFDASEVAGGGMAATILKFITGKKSVVEVQGEIFRKAEHKENLKSRLLKKIGQFAMKNAARIRVISHAISDQVRGQGIPAEKIRLISLRVDLDLFNPIRFVEPVRRTLYVGDKVVDKHECIIIGYIGRLVDGKGLEDLLLAIANLKSKFQISNFKLLIFGQGLLEEKLKKMAKDKDLDVAHKIEWRGFVSYNKVPEALAQIDIFVYPSWHEGFGRSIMEALAMEKPVVATRVGGIPDLVKDGENGFLIRPNNPEELTLKLKELIDNAGLREKFGKFGREWVSKNFEWNQGIKQFAQLFLELKSSNTNITNKHE